MGDAEAHCREMIQRLHPFVDDELEEEVCEQLRQHLSGCTHCHGLVSFERAFRAAVKEKCTEKEIPAGLEERLRAELRKLI